MNINNIKIRNYKGISDLNFNPKKMNIIVGKNNTGKTSVLEALNLLFYNDNILIKDMHSYFNIYAEDKIINISIKDDKRQKVEKIVIKETKEKEITDTFIKDLVNNFLENFNKRSKNKISSGLTKDLQKVVEKYLDNNFRNYLLQNSLVLLNNEGKEKICYLPDYDYEEKLDKLLHNLSNYILHLTPPEQKEEFKFNLRYAEDYTKYFINRIQFNKLKSNNQKELIYIKSPIIKSFAQRTPKDSEKMYKIEKIVKENNLINNLESLDFDNVVFSKEDGSTEAHSFSFLGDGFKSIIGLLEKLSDRTKNTIILLDEPETHLHPGYIEQLIKFIADFSRKQNLQFFIVTHSPDVLDILLSEDIEEEKKNYIKKELTILKMDKTKDSITLAESLNYEEAKETKEKLLLDLRGI